MDGICGSSTTPSKSSLDFRCEGRRRQEIFQRLGLKLFFQQIYSSQVWHRACGFITMARLSSVAVLLAVVLVGLAQGTTEQEAALYDLGEPMPGVCS